MNAIREALLRGRRRPRLSGAGSPTHYRGDGYEFVELREYAPGDDVRRIDWAATARTGSLQTRVVLEDVALTLAAAVDTSPSMQAGRNRPLADAAAEALQMWERAAGRDDRVVRAFSDDVLEHPRQSDAPFDLRAALEVCAAVLPRGSALLVIGDFWDLPESIEYLGRRFDCTALVARDPWRDDLPLAGFVTVADAETNERRSLYVGARERSAYARASADRETQLLERLSGAGWRAELFDETDDGGAALLRAFALR